MKKGILIDVTNKEVRYVEIGDRLEDIYNQLNCNLFEIVRVDESNDLYVDEEGLLKLTETTGCFVIEGYNQPLVGNGLILGVDPDGMSMNTTIDIEDIKRRITFHGVLEFR